jgi:hypothetical protein
LVATKLTATFRLLRLQWVAPVKSDKRRAIAFRLAVPWIA